jgi:hypothetical protein
LNRLQGVGVLVILSVGNHDLLKRFWATSGALHAVVDVMMEHCRESPLVAQGVSMFMVMFVFVFLSVSLFAHIYTDDAVLKRI